jgi:hypothetical protein
MAFRSTEISAREVLLDGLQARGIKVGHELSFTLPEGRMAPDAVLSNGADYVLETKLGGEADLFEDIKKLTEWMKLRSAPIRGAFAVLMPGELRDVPWQDISDKAVSSSARFEVAALFRDERPADRIRGSLEDIVTWMARHILQPTLEFEPDPDFIVKVLAGAVSQLASQMKNLEATQLADIFGGKTVFDNILEIRTDEMPTKELRSAASYLLINQLIFYGVLSSAYPVQYNPIDTDNLKAPSDLIHYFRKVLEVDYAPTFGFDIASRLAPKSLDTVKSVVEVVQAIGIGKLRQEVLGKVFHNLIPLTIRKPVAAYYTNGKAAELLARLAVRSADDKVLDPHVVAELS